MTGSRTPSRTPPAVAAPAPFAPPPFVRHTLRNGMHALIAPRLAGVPLVDLQIVLRGGATLDSPPRAGRAMLTGALLREGTATRGATAIAEELEQLGARLTVAANWDAWTLSLHALEPALDAALTVVEDIVVNATLPDEAFQRKRAEQRADWLRDRSEPAVLADECLQRSIFGAAHPYASPRYGSDRTLDRLRADDARRLRAAAMQPRHAFVAAAGAIDVERLARRLDDGLGRWQAGNGEGLPTPPAAPAPAGAIRILSRPGAPQSEVRAGLAGPPRSVADYFPLIVLNTVLGGAFTSRLNRTLREERGYTYGARSAFAFRQYGGPFTVSAAVFSDATADTVAVIRQHIAELVETRLTAAELERARNFLARGLPRAIESGELHAEQLARIELYGLSDDFLDHYVERVLAVQAEDVLAAARRWLDPAALSFAIAGDAARFERSLAELGAAPILVESH